MGLISYFHLLLIAYNFTVAFGLLRIFVYSHLWFFRICGFFKFHFFRIFIFFAFSFFTHFQVVHCFICFRFSSSFFPHLPLFCIFKYFALDRRFIWYFDENLRSHRDTEAKKKCLRLIVSHLSTEIFSKRRKIHTYRTDARVPGCNEPLSL